MGQQRVHHAKGGKSLPNLPLQAGVLEEGLPSEQLSGIRYIILATLTDKL